MAVDTNVNKENARKVLESVAQHYRQSLDLFLPGRGNSRIACQMRLMGCLMLKEYTECTDQEIAELMGRVSRTSVVEWMKKVEELMPNIIFQAHGVACRSIIERKLLDL